MRGSGVVKRAASYKHYHISGVPVVLIIWLSLKMVLDDCDVCMEYWVTNESNMEGYECLASNQHIPMAHDPAHNISMQTQPPVQDSPPPKILTNILPTNPDYTFKRSSELADAGSITGVAEINNSTRHQYPYCNLCASYADYSGDNYNGELWVHGRHISDAHWRESVNISQNSETRPITDDQHRHVDDQGWLAYVAATNGEWNSFQDYLPDAKTDRIGIKSETALMVAVGSGPKTAEFVKELLKILNPSDLEMTDKDGRTALGIAATVGNMKAAKLLVAMNSKLPNISSGYAAGFPIHCAAENGHKKLLLYLRNVTTNKAHLNPFGRYGYGKKLLTDLLKAQFYDVAVDLLSEDIKLISSGGAIKGLNLLAENPSAFSYGKEATFLNWFIEKCQPDPDPSKSSLLHVQLWKLCGKLFPPLKLKQEGEELRDQAIHLTKLFCSGAKDTGDRTTGSVLKYKLPMLLAAANGIYEIIQLVTAVFPYAMWYNENNHSDIFRLAVSNRHHNVYNSFYEMGDLYLNTVRQSVDEKGDSMLHLVAKLAPPQRLNLITGAASQMQHEVQWYKEVENLVPLTFRNLRNLDGLTPRDVFLQSHQQLMAEAEKWMKGTATSCTVSAALIATVVFAAAITVPGGNSGKDGTPMFARNKPFIIFGVADALSLFASCVSILMFLSILTSRYAEHDFLYKLPKRLIIGLLALFVSIASMMVAFSATLYLVFGAHKLWILTSVIASAFLPVAIFASLQFSLLSEMISSTYGSSRFKSRRKTSFPTDTCEEDQLQLLVEAP